MRVLLLGLLMAAGLAGCAHLDAGHRTGGDQVQVCRPGSAVIYTRNAGQVWPGERILTHGGSCKNP